MKKEIRGLSLSTIIPVILIVLKSLEIINLSWFWVLTSFIWIPLIIVVSFMTLFFITVFIFALISSLVKK